MMSNSTLGAHYRKSNMVEIRGGDRSQSWGLGLYRSCIKFPMYLILSILYFLLNGFIIAQNNVSVSGVANQARNVGTEQVDSVFTAGACCDLSVQHKTKDWGCINLRGSCLELCNGLVLDDTCPDVMDDTCPDDNHDMEALDDTCPGHLDDTRLDANEVLYASERTGEVTINFLDCNLFCPFRGCRGTTRIRRYMAGLGLEEQFEKSWLFEDSIERKPEPIAKMSESDFQDTISEAPQTPFTGGFPRQQLIMSDSGLPAKPKNKRNMNTSVLLSEDALRGVMSTGSDQLLEHARIVRDSLISSRKSNEKLSATIISYDRQHEHTLLSWETLRTTLPEELKWLEKVKHGESLRTNPEFMTLSNLRRWLNKMMTVSFAHRFCISRHVIFGNDRDGEEMEEIAEVLVKPDDGDQGGVKGRTTESICVISAIRGRISLGGARIASRQSCRRRRREKLTQTRSHATTRTEVALVKGLWMSAGLVGRRGTSSVTVL